MRVRASFLILGFSCLAVSARATVEVEATPCFDGSVPATGVVPFVLTLRNTGGSASGAAVIQTGSQLAPRRYIYPVALPPGAVKRLMVYPRRMYDGSELRLHFEGRIRARDVNLESALKYTEDRQVGFVGDRIGAIAGIRKIKIPGTRRKSSVGPPSPYGPSPVPGEMPGATLGDTYAKPENAPDRPVGYETLAALVLGDGCERLNAAQWNAIRQWVLGGGSLVILGGAGATYTKLPDIQPLMPVTNLQSRTAPSLGSLGAAPNNLPAGPYALTAGTPVDSSNVMGQIEGVPTIVSRPYGTGCVSFAAFSPLELPLRGSPAVPEVWLRLLSSSGALQPTTSLWKPAAEEDSTGGPPMPGSPYPMPVSRPVAGSGGVGNDPFQIELPPVEVVIAVFLAYFILVVPATYLVLKRKQRLEWAWITSPILSIACAYVFYLFTASLYQAGLSRRTSGTLVAAAGSSDAQFSGYSELFIPRGGAYRIDIEGVDALEVTPPGMSAYSYYSDTAGQPLDTVDVGAISVPEFDVGNLAFKRVYHNQSVSMGQGISAELHRDPNGGFSGTVTNRSGVSLTNVMVLWPERKVFSDAFALPVGATQMIAAKDSWDSGVFYGRENTRSSGGRDYADALTKERLPQIYQGIRALGAPRRSCAFLFAQAGGEALGPQLGKYVGSKGTVTVIVSLPAPIGGN